MTQHLSIRIDTENDAFGPQPGPELARILRKLADRIDDDYTLETEPTILLRDGSGNPVGFAFLAEKG
jgi:hypothetical protein